MTIKGFILSATHTLIQTLYQNSVTPWLFLKYLKSIMTYLRFIILSFWILLGATNPAGGHHLKRWAAQCLPPISHLKKGRWVGTTFNTHLRYFKYLVMSFGLKKKLWQFSKLSSVMYFMIFFCLCLSYNILIFSRSSTRDNLAKFEVVVHWPVPVM